MINLQRNAANYPGAICWYSLGNIRQWYRCFCKGSAEIRRIGAIIILRHKREDCSRDGGKLDIIVGIA